MATPANYRLKNLYIIVNCRQDRRRTPVRHGNPFPHPLASRLIGYARVSTDDQGTDPQRDELHAAGCAHIIEEHASCADRSRPVLARILRDIHPGDTLVVVRLDRLARSVSHLLAVIEQLEAAGASFRCRCWAPSPSSSGR